MAFLIAAGVHAKTIQPRLGHSSIKTTLDTYGHLLEGIDEAAAAALPIPIAPSTRPEVVEMPQRANEIGGFLNAGGIPSLGVHHLRSVCDSPRLARICVRCEHPADTKEETHYLSR